MMKYKLHKNDALVTLERGTKRELYEMICAYISGIETKLNQGATA